MGRLLIIATTTGYQTRSFCEVARRLSVELVFATDRCHRLEDPWRDGAIPVKFYDEEAFVEAICEENSCRRFDGVLALGDRSAVLGSLASQAMGLPGHPPSATRASGNKLESRRRFAAAGLLYPSFREMSLANAADLEVGEDEFPCVLKPVALSGSRGVVRVDGPEELLAATERVCRMLVRPDILERRHRDDDKLVLESFIPGREYAVEGILEHGKLHVLAVFDKPDPLDGPYFEESIYVTPSVAPDKTQQDIEDAVCGAVRALGLYHGPVHAECRVNDKGVFVLEVASRPIGGLCARTLRFRSQGGLISFEELLLRHALGDSVVGYCREHASSAVMMIPIPHSGIYRRTEEVDMALAVPNVVDVVITAKADQRLESLPEGSSYLGFIFARAHKASQAVAAVRAAHAKLTIVVEPVVPMA